MTPNEISERYREWFLRAQRRYDREYKGLFDKVASDISLLAADPNAKFTKAFNFNKVIDQKVDVIIAEFHDDALDLTQRHIRESWALSGEKNDKVVSSYLKTITGLKAAEKAGYYLQNTRVLSAFISRRRGASTLSDAIWKVSGQLRAEMEIQLGLGISNGDSAQTISQRIRKYLKNPDALFRRVRDNNGKLVASQKMIEYRKANGLTQGTYTSAYKNALRVARSETNQAYLLADHIRWSQLDMVLGVKVSLSAQHPEYNFPEICEVCEGIYPKEFIFVGWHPHCLCHATPVLMPEKDFMAYLKGAEKKLKPVKSYPTGFREFVRENYERFKGYKSVPYWLEDNEKIINDIISQRAY